MCTTNNDTTLAGATLSPAGWTVATTGMLRLPIVGPMGLTFGSVYPPTYVGDALTLTANAATRGRRVTAADGTLRAIMTPILSASSTHDTIWAALVRIDTPGAGSAFSAGDLALFVVNSSTTSAGTGSNVLFADAVYVGADLFKVPADLL